MNKDLIMKLSTLSILCIEDEDNIRDNIVKSLNYFVKDIYAAENGLEGLKLYELYKPDIIFTDLHMPEMNGVDLIKKIREQNDSVCIVVVTAHTDKEYLLELVDMHLEEYLVKPITYENLCSVLERCCHFIQKNKNFIKKLPLSYQYDFQHKILIYNNQEIRFNRREYLFFELLMQNSHRITTYQELQEIVWQDDFMTEFALRSLVRNLRKKLPSGIITNSSRIGYGINLEDQ